MVIFTSLAIALALGSVIAGVAAHTDEQVARELLLRRHVTAHTKRSLDKCAGSPAAKALKERAIARRAARAYVIRERRGLHSHKLRVRDEQSYSNYLDVSHDMTDSAGFTLDTPANEVFASNGTCALVPEVTIGPYYVAGELFRTDLTDGQQGVPVHLDVQFVDVSNCEGVEDLLVDIWHCNSTGVYSGVAATGQGGLDSTHGRGVQASDPDGVVEFDTLFPGHYAGRATHIHIMSTAGADQFDNGTFTGGTARHIGQMFFDADLIDEVEKLSPYSTNDQALTTNAEDGLAAGEATDEFDPFLDYVKLGDSLQDGLLMWAVIAVDTSADYSDAVQAAATYLEDGGVANGNGQGLPGGPGGPGGTGSADGGEATPSGTDDGSTDGSAASPTPSTGGAARAGILFF